MDLDCIVIGAGVVGIAVARALQASGRDVVLVEKERSFGGATSSRNSEVIHAGLYYAPGSLKARTCVRGRHLLYEYCQRRDVAHRRIGKVIIAVDESELPVLEKYVATAQACGVSDLRWVERDELKCMEPAVKCVRGLFSPSSGILDSHSYMQALLADFISLGGSFVHSTEILGGHSDAHGITLRLADNTTVTARTVVNSAGLYAPHLALRINGIRQEAVPRPYFSIGHYYLLTGKSPFERLVYPIAMNGGLGVHVTIDLAGRARFGPDVGWRDTIDYSFDDSRRAQFVSAIQRYYPLIEGARLAPGYTGIRPKISGPDDPTRDFVVQGAETHGVPGLVNLFGIESPGLTASLALAEMVARLTSN